LPISRTPLATDPMPKSTVSNPARSWPANSGCCKLMPVSITATVTRASPGSICSASVKFMRSRGCQIASRVTGNTSPKPAASSGAKANGSTIA
jgi:hypothetical protein